MPRRALVAVLTALVALLVLTTLVALLTALVAVVTALVALVVLTSLVAVVTLKQLLPTTAPYASSSSAALVTRPLFILRLSDTSELVFDVRTHGVPSCKQAERETHTHTHAHTNMAYPPVSKH